MYAVLPTGSFHGWGVCGKYIAKELARHSPVHLVTEGLSFAGIQDEFDFRLLRSLLVPEEELSRLLKGEPRQVDVPVLQNIVDKSLRPSLPHFRGSWNVGYTFFEDTILTPDYVENARRFFDLVVTGSRWCEEVLRRHGLQDVTTVIQGIDPTIFHPLHSGKEYLRDSFVLFSGGKFEIRKGQDLVLRAYKVLQDRYRDVMLVNSWYNHWAGSMATMSASPYIRFEPVSGDYRALMERTLMLNGIDLERVMILPPYPNVMMPRIYRNTDIGVFPNRCEGGTNLVLMEYMACGKPVIASYSSGHKDILTEWNSVRLERMRPITIQDRGVPVAVWDDPDLEELIARLDWAYHHRAALETIGEQAGRDLSLLTWESTGNQFSEILTQQLVTSAAGI